ncbi:uncharacterized protein LOC130647458 [Hydractinia symbiolongicarpus]|uniref:uncharacterized protein LOC130647458 n=1 Tax=Hydractinia symbiolongicarpus TaxID=13093 RepID=UPI0025507B99|nr:uncharacterized protein LOC130647458 [Hydractinia symbiolongicarpus]
MKGALEGLTLHMEIPGTNGNKILWDSQQSNTQPYGDEWNPGQVSIDPVAGSYMLIFTATKPYEKLHIAIDDIGFYKDGKCEGRPVADTYDQQPAATNEPIMVDTPEISDDINVEDISFIAQLNDAIARIKEPRKNTAEYTIIDANMEVSNKSNIILVEGDIVVPDEKKIRERKRKLKLKEGDIGVPNEKKKRQKRVLTIDSVYAEIAPKPTAWRLKKIPYMIKVDDYAEDQITLIRYVINIELNSFSCLKFEEHPYNPAETDIVTIFSGLG